MPENFITLKCESCGGKLEVYDDIERFACGYCGTEMVVQRRGGTVALKLVQEAIKKVQIGTDKTAAELALVRLTNDLNPLKTKAQRLRNDPKSGQLFFCSGASALIAFIIISQSTGSQLENAIIPLLLSVVLF